MAVINQDMTVHKWHADREEVWAEVLDWYKREKATDPELVALLAMYDRLQLEGADLLKAFRAMAAYELAIVSRLATAALCQLAYRHHAQSGDDDDGE